MKKTTMLSVVFFYGAIWGILEATLGHVLHFIPATIAGSIMFPIASYILYKTYQRTESKRAMFYVGLIAASIKSVDLLLPALSIYKTINPMISILLESLVVVLVITLVVSKKPQLSYTALPVASLSWRALFVGYMMVLFSITGMQAPFIKTPEAMFSFIVISGLLSGVIASVFIFIDRVSIAKIKVFEIKPIYASILFIAAVITTYTL